MSVGIGCSADPTPLIEANRASHMVTPLILRYLSFTHRAERYVNIPLSELLILLLHVLLTTSPPSMILLSALETHDCLAFLTCYLPNRYRLSLHMSITPWLHAESYQWILLKLSLLSESVQLVHQGL